MGRPALSHCERTEPSREFLHHSLMYIINLRVYCSNTSKRERPKEALFSAVYLNRRACDCFLETASMLVSPVVLHRSA